MAKKESAERAVRDIRRRTRRRFSAEQKIRLDDPALTSDPGPPADVGATDFTLEFFMKANVTDNFHDVEWCE